MDSDTVTDKCTEGFYNVTDIHGYKAVSSEEGEGLPNLWVVHHASTLSSALFSMN
jgi:hypothetical protein